MTLLLHPFSEKLNGYCSEKLTYCFQGIRVFFRLQQILHSNVLIWLTWVKLWKKCQCKETKQLEVLTLTLEIGTVVHTCFSIVHIGLFGGLLMLVICNHRVENKNKNEWRIKEKKWGIQSFTSLACIPSGFTKCGSGTSVLLYANFISKQGQVAKIVEGTILHELSSTGPSLSANVNSENLGKLPQNQ